jgi:endo-beta-N-acetylglucosaminidase D
MLTNGMRELHSEKEDEGEGSGEEVIKRRSWVIWYDAVTIEGKLQWQDGLTDLNKPFFDVCDGIFVNYTWKENSITTTLQNLTGTAGPLSSSSPTPK